MDKKSAKLAAMPIPSAPGALSVETNTIGELFANPVGRTVLHSQLPPLEQYFDQVSDMTLVQLAPISAGAIDDAKLAAIQQELDAAVSRGQ